MTPKEYESKKSGDRIEENDIIVFSSPDGKKITENLLVLEVYQDSHCGKKIIMVRVYDQSQPEGSRRYSVDLDYCTQQEKAKNGQKN